MVMKKKVIKAEEEAVSLQQKAKIKHEEAEELRKRLELAQIGEQHYQLQQPHVLPLVNSGTSQVSIGLC